MIWLLYVTAIYSCLSLLRECYLKPKEGQILANIDKTEESAQRTAGRNIRCAQSKQHLLLLVVIWVKWSQSSRDPQKPMCSSEQLPAWFLPLPRNISAVRFPVVLGVRGSQCLFFVSMVTLVLNSRGRKKVSDGFFSSSVMEAVLTRNLI